MMTECGICGKKESNIIALVEGVLLTVCQNCAQYGKVVQVKEIEEHSVKPLMKERRASSEPEEALVPDYAERIKKAREALHLKQEELAQKIAEKESLIHTIESGKIVASFAVIKKLERFLHITLIEIHASVKERNKRNTLPTTFTIGDLMKK